MSYLDQITVGGTTYDVQDSASVHFTSQTLSDANKLQARANIGAAAIDDSCADWMYKTLIASDGDWDVAPSGTYSGATCKKVGRTFSFARTGTGGTTRVWANLTGSTHRSFTASESTSAALDDIKANGNADFVNIPKRLAQVPTFSNFQIRIAVNLYADFAQTSTDTSSNQIGLRYVFRKLNTDTNEYEYSELYKAGSVNYQYGSIGTILMATTKAFDQPEWNQDWVNYDQVAVYLMRYSNSIRGTVTLEPAEFRATPDPVVTDSSATPTITAVSGARYICSASAVSELSFTPASSGICSVRFKSGSTPTVLTLPNTVKMPDWWTGPAASTTYEISIEDGVYGVVTSWT